MDLRIREAEPTEYAALGDLTARAYLDDGLLDFGGGDPYLPVLKDVAGRAAAAEVLVAVRDGALLGGVTLVPDGGPVADIAGPGEAEVRALAVARESRGQGVGEALVRACVDRARAAEGRTAVVLSSRRSMHAAHRLYERLGFVRTPERDWNPVPHLDDLTLLTYRLTL
ncbi:GNAT family N-acetyltransferase [Streptomyces sp. NPDC017936]|uniref:GNAT family N-acetyltransferase n=1 Tax=Streptomyces sp. NPDC017936 TaxID=3365016 RepID=UPI003796CCA1